MLPIIPAVQRYHGREPPFGQFEFRGFRGEGRRTDDGALCLGLRLVAAPACVQFDRAHACHRSGEIRAEMPDGLAPLLIPVAGDAVLEAAAAASVRAEEVNARLSEVCAYRVLGALDRARAQRAGGIPLGSSGSGASAATYKTMHIELIWLPARKYDWAGLRVSRGLAPRV